VDEAARDRAAFRDRLRATGGCSLCGSRGPHICFGEPDPAQERICAALMINAVAIVAEEIACR
jgi:hypothetical protein